MSAGSEERNQGNARLPTDPGEVGTMLRIIHRLGGKASFVDLADPAQHVETLGEPAFSADLIRRALDACTTDASGALVLGADESQYLRLLARLDPERGRGRPRIPFALRYDAAYVVAITVQRRFHVVYLADLLGAPVICDGRSLLIDTGWSTGEPNYADLMQSIEHILNEYARLPAELRRPVLSLALTAPGPVDIGQGMIQARQMGELATRSIVDELTDRFKLRTLLHEDSQAFALAEMYTGRQETSLLAITLGEGFGYAVLRDGRLLTGAHSGWQSSSHLVLPFVSPSLVCPDCHRPGCLRAYLGKAGRAALQAVRPDWTGSESIHAQRLTQDLLAHVVAIQAITLDPAHVAFDIGSQYLEAYGSDVPVYDASSLLQTIRELVTVPGRTLPMLEMSRLAPSPRVRGAGVLTLHTLFQRPDAAYWRNLSRSVRRERPL